MDSSLESQVAALAMTAVDKAFRQPAHPGAPTVGGIDSPIQFPSLDHLMQPARLSAIYEGIVIEKAFSLALRCDSRYLWVGKQGVEVTKSDLGLAENNKYRDLTLIEPAPAGRRGRSVEIDVIAVHKPTARLRLCEIKRQPTAGDRDRVLFSAATLAAKRVLNDDNLHVAGVDPVRVRWFAEPADLPPGFVCRKTVDDAVNANVRNVVDRAVAAFRATFEQRFRILLGQAGRYDATPDPEPPSIPTERPVDTHNVDIVALRRAFGRGARYARNA